MDYQALNQVKQLIEDQEKIIKKAQEEKERLEKIKDEIERGTWG